MNAKRRPSRPARVFRVGLFDRTALIAARSERGALRDYFASLEDDAHVEVADGRAVYEAGRNGTEIINAELLSGGVDPNQNEIAGLDDVDEPDAEQRARDAHVP